MSFNHLRIRFRLSIYDGRVRVYRRKSEIFNDGCSVERDRRYLLVFPLAISTNITLNLSQSKFKYGGNVRLDHTCVFLVTCTSNGQFPNGQSRSFITVHGQFLFQWIRVTIVR